MEERQCYKARWARGPLIAEFDDNRCNVNASERKTVSERLLEKNTERCELQTFATSMHGASFYK